MKVLVEDGGGDAANNSSNSFESRNSSGRLAAPPYYIRDFTLFHQKECTLPRDFPPTFAVIYSVVWFIIWCFLVERIYRLKKPRVLVLARCTFIYHSSLELLMLATVLQEGFYEFAAVFLTVTYILIVTLMTLIMVDMLEFSSALPRVKVEKMKSKFYSLLWVGIGVETFFGFGCVLFARTEHFNRVLVGLLLSNQIVSTSATGLCYKYTNDFLTKTLRDEKAYSDLIQRIQRMKNTWVKLLGSVHVLPITMVGLWAKNGHIPYQYMICYGVLSVGTLSTIGLICLFPRYSSPPNPSGGMAGRQHRGGSINNDTTEPVSEVTAYLGGGGEEEDISRVSSPVQWATNDV